MSVDVFKLFKFAEGAIAITRYAMLTLKVFWIISWIKNSNILAFFVK